MLTAQRPEPIQDYDWKGKGFMSYRFSEGQDDCKLSSMTTLRPYQLWCVGPAGGFVSWSFGTGGSGWRVTSSSFSIAAESVPASARVAERSGATLFFFATSGRSKDRGNRTTGERPFSGCEHVTKQISMLHRIHSLSSVISSVRR